MSAVTAPLVVDLCYRREAYTMQRVDGRDKLVRNSERDLELPIRPPQFTPQRGNYADVSREATRLNNAQTQSGFMDYLFFPETVGTIGAR